MKNINAISLISMGLLLSFSGKTWGQNFIGTFVAVKGEVKVLREPLSAEDQKGPFLRFEDKDYVFSPAKIGQRVEAKQVVHTGTDGQARITYKSGDHLVIGPGSAIAMPAPKTEGPKGGSAVEVIYGKLRAMVSKNGPLKKLEVKTPSAVAGVRGTDFYLNHVPQKGSSLTVMRGSVDVKMADEKKLSLVKTGYTAQIPERALETQAASSAAPETRPGVIIKEATKEQLIDIQTSTHVKAAAADLKALPPESKKELEQLEKASGQAILMDIKVEQPDLYEKLVKDKVTDATEMSTATVAGLYSAAPAEKPKAKPSIKEIETLGEDVYDKYFKGK